MRRTLLFKQIAVAILLLVPFAGNAQRLLDENFGTYQSGDLKGQNEWTLTPKSTQDDYPVQIVGKSLTYAGYSEQGSQAAKLGKDVLKAQDLGKAFTDNKSDELYFSALISVEEADIEAGKDTYFLSLTRTTSFSTTDYARVFIKKGSTDNTFNIGISRGATTAVYAPTDYALDETHLLVVKYVRKEGTTNDPVYLYVDNITGDTYAAVDDRTMGSEIGANAFMGIQLRQGGQGSIDPDTEELTVSKQAPIVYVDAIRIAETWSGITGGEEPEPIPGITATTDTQSVIGELPAGVAYPISFTVKGKNLKGDISVAIKGDAQGEMTCETTTIAKADAEKEEGVNVTFTLTPTSPEIYSETVTFSSEGCEPVESKFYWSTMALNEVADMAAFRAKYTELEAELGDYVSEEKFRFTGEALVSHAYIDKSGKANIFIQDATGGLKIIESFKGDFQTTYAAGDKISGFVFTATVSWGSMTAYSVSNFDAPVSQGNEAVPATLTLAELKAQGARYEGCLVKVENVTITPSAAGKFGDDGTTPIYLKQVDTDNSTLNVLPGADFIGETIPETALSITGVSTNAEGTAIAPRSISDIDADFNGGEEPNPNPEPDDEVEVGENLLLNGSFEEGTENAFLQTYNPEDWDEVSKTAKETATVKEGEVAVKITGIGYVGQNVSVLRHTFTPGEAYALILNYHVLTSQGDNDLQLDCAWGGVDIDDPNADKLQQHFTGEPGTWEQKRIRIVVPEGRNHSFSFKLNIAKGAVVIVDDFSLYKLEAVTTGVEIPLANGLTAWSESGVLYIDSHAAQTLDVYSLNGTLINRADLTVGVNAVNLPAGAYIIKAGTDVQKILVK